MTSLSNVFNKVKPEIKKRVLSDDIVEYLTDAIMRGDFPPGSKIIELQAAKMFSVSQSTVREALRELESRGFLESKPYKGTFVRRFTIEGLKDYFRTRTELELLAAEWAAGGDPKTVNVAGMESLLQEMAGVVSEKNHVAFRRMDMEFHRTIVKNSGSSSLLSAWSALSHSYWAYFGLYFEEQQYNLGDQMEKHLAIYDILKSGRMDSLKEAIQSHYVDISYIIRVTG
jgi:DNA-binding GntR family transcriptional regulator